MGRLTRRQILSGALAQAALLSLAGCASGARPTLGSGRPSRGPRRGRRPSVLFIAIDDLNHFPGCMTGFPGADTPHLDALAREGRLFTNAHATAPACNPSRSSLLTGLSPSALGVYDNRTHFRVKKPDVLTLPQRLGAAGWRTLCGGKVFHPNAPDDRSWQLYQPPFKEKAPAGRPLAGLMTREEYRLADGLDRLFDWGPSDTDATATGDGQVVTWAEEQLALAGRGPLFLAVGFGKPHLPWYVPRSYFDALPLDRIVLPQVDPRDLDDVGPQAKSWVEVNRIHADLLQPETAKRAVRAYLAAVRFLDDQLGLLLSAWRASPHSEGGVVVLWSDHGFHLGEKLHWRKATLWEESTRVPLVIAADGVEQPGVSCRRPTSLQDLYPTVLELCGLKRPPGLDGESLLPWLQDPQAPRDRPAVTVWTEHAAAVRSERYRYIRYGDGFEELYDHEADPLEWHNLAAQPELATLRAELARYLPA